jgi:hypothetical protein
MIAEMHGQPFRGPALGSQTENVSPQEGVSYMARDSSWARALNNHAL